VKGRAIEMSFGTPNLLSWEKRPLQDGIRSEERSRGGGKLGIMTFLGWKALKKLPGGHTNTWRGGEKLSWRIEGRDGKDSEDPRGRNNGCT